MVRDNKKFYVAGSNRTGKISYLMESAAGTFVAGLLLFAGVIIAGPGRNTGGDAEELQAVPADTNAVIAELNQITEKIKELAAEQGRLRLVIDSKKNVALTNNQQIVKLNEELAAVNLKFEERFRQIPEVAAAMDALVALEMEERDISSKHKPTFEKLSAARKKRALGDTSEELGKEIEELEKQMQEMDARLTVLPAEKREASRKIAEVKRKAGETDELCINLRKEAEDLGKRINAVLQQSVVSGKEGGEYERIDQELRKLARRRMILSKALEKALREVESVVQERDSGGNELPAGENQGS